MPVVTSVRARASLTRQRRAERKRKMETRNVSLTNVCILHLLYLPYALPWLYIVDVVMVQFIADVCRECGHVIAVHQYSFSVDEEYQV